MAATKPDHLERTAAEPRDSSLHAVTLVEARKINEEIRIFRLETSTPIHFLPGQWLDVFLPGVSKAGGYTITSSPLKARPHLLGDQSSASSTGYLELAVQKSPDPPAAWLWQDVDLIIYAELQVRVGGGFIWPPPGVNLRSLRRAVFVAGGVGINPLISMLGTLAESTDKEPCSFDVQFLYSLKDDVSKEPRQAARFLFLERLVSIFGSGKVNGHLQLFLTGDAREGEGEGVMSCGEEGSKVPFRRRRMTMDDVSAAVGGASERKAAVVYVCGHPKMTDEFVTGLRHELGMEPCRVLCERWW
ncbi:hypothetical protein GGR54DRAFT_645041 [Hypoxylon sp. NC1633]|nr:hypothetical protein GGR54DRAFT_645041 [Hypoxylon sp. NC1633]